jgi:hypothetical protein
MSRVCSLLRGYLGKGVFQLTVVSVQLQNAGIRRKPSWREEGQLVVDTIASHTKRQGKVYCQLPSGSPGDASVDYECTTIIYTLRSDLCCAVLLDIMSRRHPEKASRLPRPGLVQLLCTLYIAIYIAIGMLFVGRQESSITRPTTQSYKPVLAVIERWSEHIHALPPSSLSKLKQGPTASCQPNQIFILDAERCLNFFNIRYNFIPNVTIS